MLAKHKWLTVVGSIAMAVAIALGASAFEVISVHLREDLPLPNGERIVAIRYASSSTASADGRVLHAFAAWRGQVKTIEHLGAFRIVQRNLVTPNAPPEPIPIAEISAAAFVLAGTPPLHGRYLLPSDELDQAAPVVVIGYDTWRLKFGSDPTIVGRTVLIGGVQSTIAGIMPEGFRFPIREQFWMPLRLDPMKWRPWEGPEIELFGRLAPGVSSEQAKGELASLGREIADAHPDKNARLQPIVLPFPRAQSDLELSVHRVDVTCRAVPRRRAVVPRRDQSRGAALCAHHHASRRDRRPHGPRCEPRSHPLAAVRRSAAADDDRRRRRAGDLADRAGARRSAGRGGAVLVGLQAWG